jgi:hypothetical protein
VVDKIVLRQIYLWILQFSAASYFTIILHLSVNYQDLVLLASSWSQFQQTQCYPTFIIFRAYHQVADILIGVQTLYDCHFFMQHYSAACNSVNDSLNSNSKIRTQLHIQWSMCKWMNEWKEKIPMTNVRHNAASNKMYLRIHEPVKWNGDVLKWIFVFWNLVAWQTIMLSAPRLPPEQGPVLKDLSFALILILHATVIDLCSTYYEIAHT